MIVLDSLVTFKPVMTLVKHCNMFLGFPRVSQCKRLVRKLEVRKFSTNSQLTFSRLTVPTRQHVSCATAPAAFATSSDEPTLFPPNKVPTMGAYACAAVGTGRKRLRLGLRPVKDQRGREVAGFQLAPCAPPQHGIPRRHRQ